MVRSKTKTSTATYIIGGVVLAGGLALAVSLMSGGSPKKVAPAPSGPNEPGEGNGGNNGTNVPTPPADPEFDPDDWTGDLPLPTADEVEGSVTANWGITPTNLRPLFLLAEQVSKIRGSARILSIIARRESRWVNTAHNDTSGEVDAALRAYNDNKAKRPTLKYGTAASAFGSGGLFGQLAPYYLWTGFNSLNEKSPLLNAEPETMFFQRCAAFAAVCYMQRLLANYDIRDIPDIKVGWASVSLLTGKYRGGEDYLAVRGRFAEDVQKSEISLTDPTIPDIKAMISDAKNWPGVKAVFDALVGQVPVRQVINA